MYYVQTGIEDGQGAREDGEELEHEEQAVNLRRQKRDRSKRGSVKGVACSNSNTSASGSSKPDNIVQAGSEVERARDIQHKTVYVSDFCFSTFMSVLCTRQKKLFFFSLHKITCNKTTERSDMDGEDDSTWGMLLYSPSGPFM
jgi:hypothetical protein